MDQPLPSSLSAVCRAMLVTLMLAALVGVVNEDRNYAVIQIEHTPKMSRLRDSNINDTLLPTNSYAEVSERPSAGTLSFVVDYTALSQGRWNDSDTIADYDDREAGAAHDAHEDIRFVLFLSDANFFKGAFALVESLGESRNSTALPPLVMVVGNCTIEPVQQSMLESLGAQVKILSIPRELEDAIEKQKSRGVNKRWESVFTKMLLFLPEIVECGIVFYIDLDAVARGNVVECMDGIIQDFRSNSHLELMASGNNDYFNNGVMLARPSARTFSYMVDMLRNGTCKENCSDYNMFRNGTCEGNCTDYNTVMWRKVATDQDIFIEYTQRFPERFRPINQYSVPTFNLRPMHKANDEWSNCSIVHFAGAPKPWEVWFPEKESVLDGGRPDEFPLLPNGDLPKSIHEMKIQLRESGLHWDLKDWAIIAWRDRWNSAVVRSRVSEDKNYSILQIEHTPRMDMLRDSNINDTLLSANSDAEVGKRPSAGTLSFVVDNTTLNHGRLKHSDVIADYDVREARAAHDAHEEIRFVLFLSDANFFKGAFALVESLRESRNSTALPPLVMVVGNCTIQPVQQSMLESLGAQVKILSIPRELEDAIEKQKSRGVKKRWESVFTKMLLFLPEIVECGIVFYIDLDAVARGNLIECMDGIIQDFRSNPHLELVASGNNEYFNNGVMLARPSARTFSYMVDMLRNGTCMENCSDYNMFRNGTCEGNCTDYNTVMWHRVATDQDIFIEYTQRFPERFRPINQYSVPTFNLRPMHIAKDEWSNCSIVHFAGAPKPWEVWFPEKESVLDGGRPDEFPLLPNGDLPKSIHEMKIQLRESGLHWDLKDWAIIAWRDRWNSAVARSRVSELQR